MLLAQMRSYKTLAGWLVAVLCHVNLLSQCSYVVSMLHWIHIYCCIVQLKLTDERLGMVVCKHLK